MNWNQIAEDYLRVAELVIGPMQQPIEDASREIAECLRKGGKVLFCGNGGSAADAQHLAGEFVNRFLLERKPYAGIALTTDASVMTAIGNDYAFDQIFEKQVQALGKPGDILLGISTSGNAGNVARAFVAAKAMGLTTMLLTGGTGGRIAPMADRVLSISCTKSTPRIQEGHLLVMHALCERIEERMEGK